MIADSSCECGDDGNEQSNDQSCGTKQIHTVFHRFSDGLHRDRRHHPLRTIEPKAAETIFC
jgi:hypothetical protein